MYKVIRAKKAEFEDVFFSLQSQAEEKALELYKKDPAEAVAYLTRYTNDNLNKVEKGWWDFAFHLIGKFYDGGMISEEGKMTSPGYPTEYLKKVGYGDLTIRDLERAKSRKAPK